MKDDKKSEKIIAFKPKENKINNEIIKPNEAQIIDLFASKKLLSKSKQDKKLSNQFYINGRSLFLSGNHEKAFENLKKAEAAGCENIDLFLLLSHCYGIKNDISKSEEYARKVLELDKDCAQAYYLVVLSHILQDKTTEETARFSVKAIMLGFEPDDLVYYFAALFFMDNNHSNFKKAKKYIIAAIDFLQQRIEQDKKDKVIDNDKLRKLTVFYNLKADACFYLQEYDEAFTLYTTCEKNNMAEISIFLNKSIIYYEKKEYDNAIKYIDLAFDYYGKNKKKYEKVLFEYINYIKALILSQINDESCFEYLEKSGKFFKNKKLLKERKKQIDKINEYEKLLNDDMTAISDEVIDIVSEFPEDKFEELLAEITESLGAELFAKIINYIETKELQDEKIKKFVKYVKENLSDK